MKRRIRLTEGDLRRIVNRSVKRIVREAMENGDMGIQRESIQSAYEMIESGLKEMFGEFAVDGNGENAISVDLGGNDESSMDYGLGFRVKIEYATF